MSSPVMQWQMLSNKPDELAAFYTRLLGWKVDANNALGYRAIDTGSKQGIGGGIWPAPPQAPTFTQIFVAVTDVKATFQQALGMGAKAIIPPQQLPDGEEMAILLDPQGMSFGLMKQRR